MRPLFILLSFSLSSTVLAGKRKKASSESNAPISETDLPALEPQEGSLWDYIAEADGQIPEDTVAVYATEELEEERLSQEHYVATIAIHGRPDAGFYIDPVQVLEADPLYISLISSSDFDIPIVINADVERWMSYYTGNGRNYFTHWLERRGIYEEMFSGQLAEAGLPNDLIYLSMIESGYKTHAYSRAAAVGLWQFISPTAKEWGLRVDWWVDERRDPELATEAAGRFLGHLYNKYDDWYLAWAAYNGGPSRVDRAIRKHGTRDFWTLVQKGAFPAETDNYVPKLIAAAIIAHYPERYGFKDIVPAAPLVYDTVEVDANIGLDVLARCAKTTPEALQDLNPHLRRWALPPEPARQFLRVPVDKGDDFLAALAKVPDSERLTFHEHKVTSGESLGAIARRYGVSVNDVQKVNRIENPNKIYVGMQLVIPTPGNVAGLVSTAGSGSTETKTRQVTHVVDSGEALSTIASRYGVKQSDLMRWNGIDNAHRIYVGQKLKLYEPASQWKSYTVRNGDNLSAIAARNNCTVSEIKSWNNLRSTRIYPGQKLKIRRD